MSNQSYMNGKCFSGADMALWKRVQQKRNNSPTAPMIDPTKYPHVHRWYTNVDALQGSRGLAMSPPVWVGPPKARRPEPMAGRPEPRPAARQPRTTATLTLAALSGGSKAQMLVRLKQQAAERQRKKVARKRTLVSLHMVVNSNGDPKAIWSRITKSIQREGLRWGEHCNTLGGGSNGTGESSSTRIETTFVTTEASTSSFDDIVREILNLSLDVESCIVASKNTL